MRSRPVSLLALLAAASAHGCADPAAIEARLGSVKASIAADSGAHVEGSFALTATAASESTEVWLYGLDVFDLSQRALTDVTIDTDASFPLELSPFESKEATIRFTAEGPDADATTLAGFCGVLPQITVRATLYDSAADISGAGFATVTSPLTPVVRGWAPRDATQFAARWSEQFPGRNAAFGAIDASGSVLITQTSSAAATTTLTKLDAEGTVKWTQQLPSTGLPRIAAGGDAVIVGDSYRDSLALGDEIWPSVGAEDVYLARMDAAGELVWSRHFGDSDEQTLAGLAVGPGGDAFALIDGPVDFGNPATFSPWSLGKLDAAGSTVFGRGFDSANAPVVLVPTAAGGAVLAGTLVAGESLDLGGGALENPSEAIWVGELDAAGEHVWSRAFAGSAAPHELAGALGPTGELTLVGTVLGSLALPGSSEGLSPGMFVLRLGPGGDVLWARTLDASRAAQPSDVVVDAAGHTFVTGTLSTPAGLGGDLLEVRGVPMQFLLELDETGEHVRSELVACNASGRFAARAGSAGTVTLTGSFGAAAAFGAGVLESPAAAYVASFGPAP